MLGKYRELTLHDFVVDNVVIGDNSFTLYSVNGHEVMVELEGDCFSQSSFDRDSIEELRGLFGHRVITMRDAHAGRIDWETDHRYGEPALVRTQRVSNLSVEPGYLHPDLHAEAKFKGECVSAHFLVIDTDKGGYSIAWRNDSNGYYDGWPNFFVDGEKAER